VETQGGKSASYNGLFDDSSSALSSITSGLSILASFNETVWYDTRLSSLNVDVYTFETLTDPPDCCPFDPSDHPNKK
jgi:hypothetical protein